MAEISPTSLPFAEAIEFFKQKLNLPTRAWTDIYGGQHARAFVVAGAMKDSLIASLHGAVLKALEQGTGIDEFRRDFAQIVAREGWSYNGGFGWRTKVIFETNLRSAYAAGEWAQAQATKARRPYLRYTAVMDLVTRPLHREWHGTILPIDDPWWNTHFPPCGWNCRCSTQSLSEADLKRFGWKVTEKAPAITWEDRTLRTPDGDRQIKVPAGIDAGFEHNIGAAAFGRGAQSAALEQHGRWAPLEAPGAPQFDRPRPPLDVTGVAPAKPADPGDVNALRANFEAAIGGPEAIFTDPIGGRVLIGDAIVDHIAQDGKRFDGRDAWFPFLPGLVEDPFEIWLGFSVNAATGRVAVRRRYFKAIDTGKGRSIGIVADQDNGYWSGLTFFRGNDTRQTHLRNGYLLYRRRGEE